MNIESGESHIKRASQSIEVVDVIAVPAMAVCTARVRQAQIYSKDAEVIVPAACAMPEAWVYTQRKQKRPLETSINKDSGSAPSGPRGKITV